MDNITMSGAFSPTNLKDYFGGGGGEFKGFGAAGKAPVVPEGHGRIAEIVHLLFVVLEGLQIAIPGLFKAKSAIVDGF